ncbi:ABC transporter ATP-binding protein [Roseibium limicola]|uniref:ABC transporter ATP-binding protein n=1 Tax=Roseibium limicola TaxID=2816037 RepID=A0A939EJJ2_9HYPH|nr:ABC transporter ATP-binding protein [Roseibium limicola]MBO0343648.1 ABC transporter ATP-binding protein [Roseibium limicola]
MTPIISIRDLEKTYSGGFQALKSVSLDINAGEVFALLGPNGAGKTTLISTICGLVQPSSGQVFIGGHDNQTSYRQARRLVGLVPQEMPTVQFEGVRDLVRLSRGLFGLAPDEKLLEEILKDLSLWDKRDAAMKELSGGMKRRVLVAKALIHQPKILFLDEPTAGVDVELRRDMWRIVSRLRDKGVTIILTTHYIEEAEEMADRVGVINNGELILVEEKAALMSKLGRKELMIELSDTLPEIPESLKGYGLELGAEGRSLRYTYDAQGERTGITGLLNALAEAGLRFDDIHTKQSSLEEIFVDLVRAN